MKSDTEQNGFRVAETAQGVTFSIHVQPKACRNEIAGLSGNELKVRLTSPPVEGAANTLCREFLAKLFHVAKSNVRIIAGEKSRHKIVEIHGATRESALALLNKHSRSSE
ncbi:MAG: YggU family protein [Deltaproteobacteria bacterium]|nr:YggU family protein [Deltaproteobacteria bacterium]